MDLESARGFVQRKGELNSAIRSHEPSRTELEEVLAPLDRFNLMWGRLDDLTQDRLDRRVVTAIDGAGIALTITRTTNPEARGSLDREWRTIEAVWTANGEELATETLSDIANVLDNESPHPDDIRILGLLEESVAATATMIQRPPEVTFSRDL